MHIASYFSLKLQGLTCSGNCKACLQMKLYMCEVFLKLYVFSGIQRFWRWEHREAGSIERQPKHVVGSDLFLGFVDTKKNKDPQRPHYVLLFLLGSLTSPPHPPLNLLFSASFTIFKRLSTSPVSICSCGAHFLSFFVFFYSLVFRIRGPLRWSIFFSWPHQTGLLPPGTLWYVGDGQEGDSIRG